MGTGQSVPRTGGKVDFIEWVRQLCETHEPNPGGHVAALLGILACDEASVDEKGQVIDAYSRKRQLDRLSLWCKNMGPEAATAIAVALTTNNTLSGLDIGRNGIGPEGGEAIGAALAKNRSLVRFNVSCNELGNEGAKAIAAAFATNMTLIRLEILGNEIGPEGAEAIAAGLAANNTLEILNAQNNPFGAGGGKAIGAALASNKSLRTLQLSDTGLDPEAGRAIAAALRSNRVLKSLILANNSVGSEGGEAIGLALAENDALTNLDLSGNGMGPVGVAEVSRSLSFNVTLMSLNLDDNNGGVAGSKAIGTALCTNKVLTTLRFACNTIGDEGIKAIGDGVASNRALTSLDLRSNNIGDEGGEYLASSLASNNQLTTIDLYANRLSDSVQTAVEEATELRLSEVVASALRSHGLLDLVPHLQSALALDPFATNEHLTKFLSLNLTDPELQANLQVAGDALVLDALAAAVADARDAQQRDQKRRLEYEKVLGDAKLAAHAPALATKLNCNDCRDLAKLKASKVVSVLGLMPVHVRAFEQAIAAARSSNDALGLVDAVPSTVSSASGADLSAGSRPGAGSGAESGSGSGAGVGAETHSMADSFSGAKAEAGSFGALQVIPWTELSPAPKYGVAGKGAFGSITIYSWRHTAVAGKELLPGGASLDEESLRREVSMFVKAGRHPHVLSPLGVCLDKPHCQLMLVLPYCQHGTLKSLIQVAVKPIMISQALEILLQVSSAVSHLHHCSPRIIHRDIRAVNVLVSAHSPVDLKLTDLGLSHAVTPTSPPASDPSSASSSSGLEAGAGAGSVEPDGSGLGYGDMTTTTLGPIRWRAPETFDYSASATSDGPRKQVASTATDVYMLGCVMYEVLYGQTPWGWLDEEAMFGMRASHGYTVDPLSGAETFGAPAAFRTPIVSDDVLDSFLSPSDGGGSGSPSSAPGGAHEVSGRIRAVVALMRKCWSPEPGARPSIDEVAAELKRIQGAVDDWVPESERHAVRYDDCLELK